MARKATKAAEAAREGNLDESTDVADEAPKNKGGRPPKRPEDRRTEMFTIPLTSAEFEEVKAAATSAKQKWAAWARELILRAARRKK